MESVADIFTLHTHIERRNLRYRNVELISPEGGAPAPPAGGYKTDGRIPSILAPGESYHSFYYYPDF
jgi:hypothetical protein